MKWSWNVKVVFELKKIIKKKKENTHIDFFIMFIHWLFFFYIWYDRKTMIKCSGCMNAYHYECLKKETGIDKKYLEEHDGILMCIN